MRFFATKQNYLKVIKDLTAYVVESFKKNRCVVINVTAYNKRTHQQNDFFHGPVLQYWIKGIEELTGIKLSGIEAKTHLKKQLEIGHYITVGNTTDFIPAETSNMSKKEFSILLNKVENFGMEWFKFPMPHPEWDYR